MSEAHWKSHFQPFGLEYSKSTESGLNMPLYDVSFRCDDCGVEHPLLTTVYLAESVEGKQSIADLFRGRELPPQISVLRFRKGLCLKTGNKLSLDNDDKLLLTRGSSG
jgi:hypothetical protein